MDRPDIKIPERHFCAEGEEINSRYIVLSRLGVGAFGHVYKARGLDGREYALKVLHLWDIPSDIRQPLIDRFEMEYRTGRIRSDYLVHSVDMGYLFGNPYIVMEFCGGGDLSAKLGKKDCDTVKIATDILHGLNDLHVNGKVHRDLKPENVLFKDGGIAALTDFGISGDRNKRMTERNIFGRPYQVFGTYAYMPPEQVNRARGGSTVLPTTDIFSFGVLIYQLITGKLPFGKLEDQNDLVMYQKRGKAGEWDRTALLDVPGGHEWERLIAGCLEPDYRTRLQNAAEVMRFVPDRTAVRRFHSDNGYGVAGRQAAPAKHRLVVLQGKEYGRVYDLPGIVHRSGRRVVTVGRAEDNSVKLEEYNTFYTSRKHFTIEAPSGEGEWVIRDGQWIPDGRIWKRSSNGTYLNSAEVTPDGKVLHTGDIISVGEMTMRYE